VNAANKLSIAFILSPFRRCVFEIRVQRTQPLPLRHNIYRTKTLNKILKATNPVLSQIERK
jgi:hypothetical protein